ncbi:MAG TPA: copper resistance protein CopC [Actinomycetota bacterium]|nr:copper resistance protein CopC [Actinomycetota bacterium]
MRRLIIIAVPALVAGILSVPAAADPGPPAYESSDPARGEKMHTKATEVSVTFNEILEPSAAELSVSACGETVDDGRPPTVTMETISIGIGENPVGTYTVAYKVSGADDTPQEKATPAEGSYTFSYHSKQCGGSGEPGDGNGEGHGHHDGGHGNGGEGHGQHGGKGHGQHGDKHGGTKHGGRGQGGHGAEGHDSTSHTGHTAGGAEHSEDHPTGDHSTGSHEGGHHKKGNGGHHSGSGKGHHHSGGHNGESHTDEPGNAGNQPTAASKPSKPNDVVNLLLVLLIPAAMGAVGGRMLRKARVKPAH